jgi:hypothetical protein
MDNDNPHTATQAGATDAAPKVKWDDSKMTTTYANVVNAASTREEVSVFFGTNETWDFGARKEFDIGLTNRIVLNPYTAKRLSILLNRILAEYERRFTPLTIDGLCSAGGHRQHATASPESRILAEAAK